jgi:hypothetical protein
MERVLRIVAFRDGRDNTAGEFTLGPDDEVKIEKENDDGVTRVVFSHPETAAMVERLVGQARIENVPADADEEAESVSQARSGSKSSSKKTAARKRTAASRRVKTTATSHPASSTPASGHPASASNPAAR